MRKLNKCQLSIPMIIATSRLVRFPALILPGRPFFTSTVSSVVLPPEQEYGGPQGPGVLDRRHLFCSWKRVTVFRLSLYKHKQPPTRVTVAGRSSRPTDYSSSSPRS
jgi:hypothetical protein